MLAQFLIVLAILTISTSGFVHNGNTVTKTSSTSTLAMSSSSSNNGFQINAKALKQAFLSTLAAGALMGSPAFAADYAPSTAPPTLTPQITKTAPRAATAGNPEKWIYSKFLDEVEKDHVEKITFAPDGKKAVGVNDDGDRFTVVNH